MSSESPSNGIMAGISKTFLAGVLAALPLTLTIAIIIWAAELTHRYLGPDSFIGGILGSFGLRFVSSEAMAYLIGLGATLAAVYFLGVAVEAGLKNRWRGFTTSLLNRVPFVRSVYQTLNKIITMFDKQDKAEFKSMSSVLCYFGGDRSGTAVLALLTSPSPVSLSGGDYYAIIIPTAPVPFGGAILYVPVSWIEKTQFGFDGLFNIYMSMGVTSGDYFKQSPPTASSTAN